MKFDDLPNYRKAEMYRSNYKKWKEKSLDLVGFFPVFHHFKEEFILRELSGNALKLYIYLGLHTGNKTGETWVTIESMARYFEKSPRTISYWLEELIEYRLITRIQLNHNEPSHTFLLPYGYNFLLDIEYENYRRELEGDEESD